MVYRLRIALSFSFIVVWSLAVPRGQAAFQDWHGTPADKALRAADRLLRADLLYSRDVAKLDALRAGRFRTELDDGQKGALLSLNLEGAHLNFYAHDGSLNMFSRPFGADSEIPNPLSPEVCRNLAEDYLRAAGVQGELECVSSDVGNSLFTLNAYNVVKGKRHWRGLMAVVSRVDGAIVSLIADGGLDYDTLDGAVLESRETCLGAADECYQRDHPYRNGQVDQAVLIMGFPWRGDSVRTFFSPQERASMDRWIAIPFYRFRYSNVDTAFHATEAGGYYDEFRFIDVDAMTGTVMSIFGGGSGYGAGGRPSSIEALMLDALPSLTVPGQPGVGHATLLTDTSEKDPAVAEAAVRSGDKLIGVRYDRKSKVVWANDGKLWRAYKPDKALNGALKRATNPKRKPFGAKK